MEYETKTILTFPLPCFCCFQPRSCTHNNFNHLTHCKTTSLFLFRRFEALEQVVLADRSQWKSILSRISIQEPDLYNFLYLIHTNQNGSNDKEIESIISRNGEPESALRRRHFMGIFDKLSAKQRSDLLEEIRSHLSLTLNDTKVDNSSSYAISDFVPRTFNQSTMYVGSKLGSSSVECRSPQFPS